MAVPIPSLLANMDVGNYEYSNAVNPGTWVSIDGFPPPGQVPPARERVGITSEGQRVVWSDIQNPGDWIFGTGDTISPPKQVKAVKTFAEYMTDKYGAEEI